MNRTPLRFLLLVALTTLPATAFASEPIVLTSPGDTARITIHPPDDARQLRYSVDYKNQPVVAPSAIEVRFRDIGSLTADTIEPQDPPRLVDDEFDLPWGKTGRVTDRYRTALVRITGKQATPWLVELRAYDDGIAFRYGLPEPPANGELVLIDENIEFRLAGDPTVLFTTCDHYKTSHEAIYTRQPASELPVGKLIDKPLTAVWPNGTAAAITEARLQNFAGMYLERPSGDETALRTRLAPRADRPDALVVSRGKLWSPWRVVLLADHAGRLIENNVLLSLNDPPASDFNWVVPGKTTFHWWNGAVEHGPPSTPENNFAIHKEYIDFCARHGIEYHSVISVAGNRPWHVQRDPGFAKPHADTDVRAARPDLGLQQILDYAKSKNVGIRFWVHWQALADHLDEAFAQYEQWGVRGLMVDFMDRDDQQMIDWQEKCLQAAARHKLHIQFHGSHKPTGEQRTYPNLFNREGVLNLEYLKWTDLCTPQHSVNVAYTRALAGPTDYHLGGFDSAPREKFKPRDLRPQIMGTRCNQLALYVVFENPMPMLADVPAAYEGQPGFEFLTDVPTTWDETRFIAGELGEYLVVARRKGEVWYLAGITNWSERELELPLSFLAEGPYTVVQYSDRDAQKPNELAKSTSQVTKAGTLSAKLVAGGGAVAVFRPVAKTDTDK